jgi:hypothetical protein
MSLGSILVAKGLVTADDVERAMEYQRENGGRFGDNLVAIGAATAEAIDAVLNEVPDGPRRLEDTGIEPMNLLQLMMKGMFAENLETVAALAEAMMLTSSVVNPLMKEATERQWVEAVGQVSGAAGTLGETRYALTKDGRGWTQEAMDLCQYFGQAPVSLEAFQERILLQRMTNEWISRPVMQEAFGDLVIPDRFVSRLGPAINSATALLIYGPAGNGKTTIAEIVGRIFENVIYVPHCFEVDGQIIKVYDPSIHKTIKSPTDGEGKVRSLRRDTVDKRWVPCYRPMVMTGGELTLEMLDLKFNEIAKFYDAPMHIKALNGTFLIDDFGRQRVAPEDILNRWIVPLNSRVDYLNLHTGKSFQLPFDELVIFSTNLKPSDLMDPAFQRRINYKLETVAPPETVFRDVFENIAAKNGLQLTDDIYQQVMTTIRANDAPLAYFQPNFIVDQVLASCKFEDMEAKFTKENVEDAMLNLFVEESEV